eukprot:275269_1
MAHIHWFALSITWFTITTLMILWVSASIFYETNVCDSNVTTSILFALFLSGQYVFGYVLCWYSRKRDISYWNGMYDCSIVIMIAIAFIYIITDCSVLLTNIYSTDTCTHSHIVLSVQCVNVLYSLVNVFLCCIILPEKIEKEEDAVTVNEGLLIG